MGTWRGCCSGRCVACCAPRPCGRRLAHACRAERPGVAPAAAAQRRGRAHGGGVGVVRALRHVHHLCQRRVRPPGRRRPDASRRRPARVAGAHVGVCTHGHDQPHGRPAAVAAGVRGDLGPARARETGGRSTRARAECGWRGCGGGGGHGTSTRQGRPSGPQPGRVATGASPHPANHVGPLPTYGDIASV